MRLANLAARATVAVRRSNYRRIDIAKGTIRTRFVSSVGGRDAR